MSWQSDIVTAILADSPTVAIIGTRLFADVAPGSAVAPFIVYQAISESGDTAHDGTRSVSFPLVQFSCWASGKAAAITLASTLKTAIEGKNLPGSSNASLGFSNHRSSRDQQTKLFGEQIDYRVSCNTN